MSVAVIYAPPDTTIFDTTPEQPVPDQSAAASDDSGAITETARVLRAHGVGMRGGISGNALAKRAGLNAETVNRYLRPLRPGAKPATMDKTTIDAIADAIPMSRHELTNAVLTDAGVIVDTAGPGNTPTAVAPGVDAVLAALPGLSDHDRRIVLAELAQLVARDSPPSAR